MIKGIVFDLDDTLTVHEDLYNINYLKIIHIFFPEYKNDQSKILDLMIKIIDEVGTKKYFYNYKNTKFGGRDILWADCGGKGEIDEYLNGCYLEIQYAIWKEIISSLEIKNISNFKNIIDTYKYLMWSGIKTFSDVIPTLTKLKNFKLGILTNGMQIHQRRKISTAGILGIFSNKNTSIVTSSECSFGKPFEKPYKLICDKLSLNFSEIIMVGDRPEGDILGANKLGIKNVLINRKSTNYSNPEEKPDYEINNLFELTNLLKNQFLDNKKSKSHPNSA